MDTATPALKETPHKLLTRLAAALLVRSATCFGSKIPENFFPVLYSGNFALRKHFLHFRILIEDAFKKKNIESKGINASSHKAF